MRTFAANSEPAVFETPVIPVPQPHRGHRNAARTRYSDADLIEFFDPQPTSTSELPNPQPLIENLTRSVVEVLAGTRDLRQISPWVTDEVYRHLLKRTVRSAQARQAQRERVLRPAFEIGTIVTCEPEDGVVESVVMLRGRIRSRAVAMRLEGMDHRWRATSINVL